MHELLKLWHAGDGAVTESFQLVVGQFALTDVSANFARGIVRRDASVGERRGGRAAVERAPGVLDAERGAEDPTAERVTGEAERVTGEAERVDTATPLPSVVGSSMACSGFAAVPRESSAPQPRQNR